MKRPIRTLLFSTLFPSSARPLHGIFVETRLRELLRDPAVEARVVAPVPWFPSSHPRWGAYASFARTPAREVRNGIEVLHPRYPVLPKIGMTIAPLLLAAAAVPTLSRLRNDGFDFDVIDAHYFYPDGVAAAMLARYFDRPLAITARGTDLNVIAEYALPRAMMRWAARHADASIGVCNALVDVLRRWGIADERLHVIRNGVDLHRFSPLPQASAREALELAGAPLLLSVGRLVSGKGHHRVVAAMPQVLQRHPQARLLIVGDGEERSRLQAQASALGIAAHVTLAGAVPNDRLTSWYSAADLLILASDREGWANVLLESMACGTPVVATRTGGTPEVVTDESVGLLVDPQDDEALTAGIMRLLAAPPDRGVVRRYAETFGWDDTSRAQTELFDRMTATRAST